VERGWEADSTGLNKVAESELGGVHLAVFVGSLVTHESVNHINYCLKAETVVIAASDENLARTAFTILLKATLPNEVIWAGNLEINLAERVVRWKGNGIDVTDQELKILAALADDVGRARSYQELERSVWQHTFYGNPVPLRSAVQRLRAKLASEGVTHRIEAARGFGFRLSLHNKTS
jgi:DNA-binding winged helix-turn-helix (wHTH) protein